MELDWAVSLECPPGFFWLKTRPKASAFMTKFMGLEKRCDSLASGQNAAQLLL